MGLDDVAEGSESMAGEEVGQEVFGAAEAMVLEDAGGGGEFEAGLGGVEFPGIKIEEDGPAAAISMQDEPVNQGSGGEA